MERGFRMLNPMRALSAAVLFTAIAGSLALGQDADGDVQPRPAASMIMGDTLWSAFKRGGPVMWPIAGCSVIGLAFVFERLVELRRQRHLPPGFAEDCAHIVDTRGVDAGLAFCMGRPNGIARVLYAALLRYGTDRKEMEAGIQDEGSRLMYDLRRNCRVLGILANVAPLLGLLGTVTGMIRCFDVVAATGTGKSHALATGIAEALLTTAFGLIVGIPLYFLYHYFRNRADDTVREIEGVAVDFVVTLDRKAKRSMRLVEALEEDLETKSMLPAGPAPANLEEEFEDSEEMVKTAIAPPPAMVASMGGPGEPGVPVQIPNPSEPAQASMAGALDEELKREGGDKMVDTRAVTLAVKVAAPDPHEEGADEDRKVVGRSSARSAQASPEGDAKSADS